MTTATTEYARYIATDHADVYDDEPMTDEDRDDAIEDARAVIFADIDAARTLVAYHAAERDKALPYIEEMAYESDLLDLTDSGWYAA